MCAEQKIAGHFAVMTNLNNKGQQMRVCVNGAVCELPPGATVAVMLDAFGWGGRKLAVEVNKEIVPKSKHACFVLSSNDQVEIIHAVGGG